MHNAKSIMLANAYLLNHKNSFFNLKMNVIQKRKKKKENIN